MKKVYDSYEELKRLYEQVLTDDDIKESFQDDKIIKDMKNTISKSQKWYLLIWVCFLVVLLVCLESLSDNPIIFPFLQQFLKGKLCEYSYR